MKAASILLSTLFTGATAECLGLLLLQRLRPRFTREEQYVYSFTCGSAILSLLVFLVAAMHLVWTATFVVIGAGAIGVCIWRKAYLPLTSHFEPLPRLYVVLLWGSMLAYGVLYGMNALAPEASADGAMYHLGLVQRYFDHHWFGQITTSMYANISLGVEMLFLFAFSLGRHSAAALVHFQFYFVLPLVVLTVGRRLGYPRAGAAAAIFVFLSPVIGYDGSSAYIDVAVACIAFSLFGVLQIWDETRDGAVLPLIGLLAGFAYAAKMTAFVAIPYATLFVLFKLWRRREPLLAPMAIVCGCIALMAGPWLLKNAITVGNPFSPFLNRFFPNPYIRISFEESYRAYHRHYDGLKSYWDIPYEAAVRGGVLNGLLGPLFLLAPLGLLSLRWRAGQQTLLAAAVFAATYPTNVGTRFLIPAAPFLAFAIALTVTQWRAMTPLLILFHALISWPDSMRTYVDPYSWRLDKFFWRAAFRLQPESEYLNERLVDYAPAKLVEQLVPKDGRIFTPGGIAHAYCRREVIVGYESALGNTMGDFIAAAIYPSHQPVDWWTYSFPKQAIRRLRIVQTGTGNDVWGVSEMRLLSPEGEVPRGAGWRLRAHPNPWQVQLAFDNCPVTRWMAAESLKPGMFVEVELDKPVELIGIRVESTPNQPYGTVRLEADVNGKWTLLSDKAVLMNGPPPGGIRRLAAEDLKRNGITHINVNNDEYFATDMARDPEAWGVSKIGETDHSKLYKID